MLDTFTPGGSSKDIHRSKRHTFPWENFYWGALKHRHQAQSCCFAYLSVFAVHMRHTNAKVRRLMRLGFYFFKISVQVIHKYFGEWINLGIQGNSLWAWQQFIFKYKIKKGTVFKTIRHSSILCTVLRCIHLENGQGLTDRVQKGFNSTFITPSENSAKGVRLVTEQGVITSPVHT